VSNRAIAKRTGSTLNRTHRDQEFNDMALKEFKLPDIGQGRHRRRRDRQLAPTPAPAAAAPVAQPAPIVNDGPILAAPATRKLARELGVDLRTVQGTGPRGRVQRDDVQRATSGAAPAATAPRAAAPAPVAAAAAPRAPSAPPAPKAPALALGQPGTETRIPLRGLRKKIAEHMALSKRTAAHFTYVEEVEVTDLVKFRAQAKESAAQRGVKLTYLPFVLKAIVAGLREFPMLNSSLDEERGEIVVRNVLQLRHRGRHRGRTRRSGGEERRSAFDPRPRT
jgi:pyruvate dehydrogenase E2 component (dihydrolipoamide acetyltransferase)